MSREKLKKSMSILSFNSKDLFPEMDENDKKEMCSWCSTVFENPLFEKIFDELYTKQVLKTLENIHDKESSVESRGEIFGIAGVKDFFLDQHLQYIEMTRPEEDFDKHESI